tara:strand:+ start:440 stop:3310 length:2871 start_codon:yes stop_codon:yes gene_type:complete
LVAWPFCTGVAAATEPVRWPFTPRSQPLPPALPSEATAANGIDHFVIDQLHERKLSLSRKARPENLVRRLYYDLIGLPPTREEVQAFVKDPSPDAYLDLVDRLLDDPRHGERWARFWLDLARYADTAGYEGDPDLPHAWRYRDYVIDSFNQDKPYDLFIKEQIAGDEFKEIMGAGDLPSPSPERMVAMTFLRLAPFTEPRGDETRHEMLSEMTSTVSSVFLGLTVGCAQCHDHKYDPIPIKDFYRMKAFFNTVWLKRPEPGDIYQIGAPLPAAHYREGEKERYAKRQVEHRKAIDEAKEDLQALTQVLTDRLGPPRASLGIQSSTPLGGNHYRFGTAPVADGRLHHSIINGTGSGWEFFTDGSSPDETKALSGKDTGHWFNQIKHPLALTLGQEADSEGRPTGNAHQGLMAEVLVYDHPLDEAERNLIDAYIQSKYEIGSNATLIPPSDGLALWLDASDPDADTKTPPPTEKTPIALWKDKVGGLVFNQSNPEHQPTVHLLQEGGPAALQFNKSLLVASKPGAPFLSLTQGAIVQVYSVTSRNEGYGFALRGEENAFLSTVLYPAKGDNADLKAILADPANPLFTAEERKRHQYLSSRERFLKQHIKRLDPMALTLRHSYGPPFEPGVPVSRIMLRGEHDNPGEVVEAGFPSALTGHQEPAPIRLDPFKRWPTRSRRMALAQWIAAPENPLTARVIVNRLWHWHFGRGIVKTPSDFGQLSGGPSHPELLDWLANQLIQNEWSLKSIHRLIVTSRTYQQTAHSARPEAERIDPENSLLWRFNPRRLEAEAIRDSVLQISGRLNPERYGPPVFPELPGGIEEAVKYDQSKWDTDHSDASRKRSIYIYQQRTLSMPFLQSFDSLVCEDTRPMRRTSTTPLQALAMYNGKLVHAEAPSFAERIRQHATSPVERIQWAFQTALGRSPDELETNELLPLANDENLPRLARVLFNTNEFVYVD